jgi:hypothetical protein
VILASRIEQLNKERFAVLVSADAAKAGRTITALNLGCR